MLSAGQKLGGYEIRSSLGALRAREARARVVDSPHIAAIYGVEEAAGIRALILELVAARNVARG